MLVIFTLFLFEQIRFVKNDDWVDAGQGRGYQIAIQQAFVEFGQGGADDQDLIDIRRNNFLFAAVVWSGQETATGFEFMDDAGFRIRVIPTYIIAADQWRQVAPGAATMLITLFIFNDDLPAKVGDDASAVLW